MSMVVENFDEWEAALQGALEQRIRDAEKSLTVLADDIARREYSTGPRDEEHTRHGVDTITVEVGRSGDLFWLDVGPSGKAFYLAFYEFGTEDQPPRPFMRPAVAAATAGWNP